MKYTIIAMLLLCCGIAQAQDCATTIWTNTNLSYCVASAWHWDQQQRKQFKERLDQGKVEIDIFEIVNSRCDMHMTVYDPYMIDKQQYLDCTENMTPQN